MLLWHIFILNFAVTGQVLGEITLLYTEIYHEVIPIL